MARAGQHRGWISVIHHGCEFSRALALGLSLSAVIGTSLAQAQTYTVLHRFTGAPDGAQPAGDLLRDWAGNLYGITSGGGASNTGVVFKLDPTGEESVLYSFMGGADGGAPGAGVIRDWAGNLYGTTSGGGASNTGVVFKLDPTGKETVLWSFGNTLSPSGLIRDWAGNLYGTTSVTCGVTPPGITVCVGGTVFKLDPTGKETVLYGFLGAADGGNPNGVIRDSAGNLYGTTTHGGNNPTGVCVSSGCGVVFKLGSTAGAAETVLYTFTGGADGGFPVASLIRDSAGNLYGTTAGGGSTAGMCASLNGCGIVFKLDPTGKETVLYRFTGGADGAVPRARVIPDWAGNLYGTASSGGVTGGLCGSNGCGVVFKLDPTGKETVLYRFTGGADGGSPNAGLIRDWAGNLYGTTVEGGVTAGACSSFIPGCGVVFKLTP